MANISETQLSHLKTSIPLLSLVQADGVELKRVGANWVGKCGFHTEKSGSLVITPSKNLFHCFGCGAAGSVIDWVMRVQRLDFRESVKYLMEKYSIKGEELLSNKETLEKYHLELELESSDDEWMKEIIGYYNSTVKEQGLGRTYLSQRGLDDLELIETYSIGYVSRNLGNLLPPSNRTMGAKQRQRLQQLGILRESGHEHFRDCIVIPIYDLEGKVGEIYGRKVTPNIREGYPTHLYLPGQHKGIFNIAELNGAKVLLLNEAIIDSLTAIKIGFSKTTSSFGVEGFTDEMLNYFKEIGIEIVFIVYDSDEPGERASLKLAHKLASNKINCFRVRFDGAKDLNEYAIKLSKGNLTKELELVKKDFIALLHKSTWIENPLGNKPNLEQAIEDLLNVNTKGEKEIELPSLAAEPLKAANPLDKELAAKKEILSSAKNDNPTNIHNPINDTKAEEKAKGISVEIKGDKEPEIFARLDQREYRVRGLHKNLSVGHMAINLRLSVGTNQDNLHIDNVELCSSKQRFRFAKDAELATGIKEKLVLSDMAKLLNKLEEIQQEHIISTLKPKKQVVEISESDREAAIEFLKQANLIGQIIQSFEDCGLVGESTNALVGYLSAISRKLSEPLAIIVQSSSAAGKSALMEAVARFVPEEECEMFSAMTGRSLFYIGEKDLKHKVLFISEQEGAKDASYAIKLLQSEGKLRIASTGKDPVSGKLVTHEYMVEGPVMIFLTTTSIEIDEELQNRCLVLYVNEDRNQTRAIHRKQRLKETLEGLWQSNSQDKLINLHQNAQRLIRPLWVVNPYAAQLTFVDARTRTRRDHMKYLSLIKSIALLHQYQRPIRESTRNGEIKQYIEVALSDIELANRLADEVLGRSLDELPPHTRNFLDKIYLMVKDLAIKEEKQPSEVRFTAKTARDYCGLSYEQTRFHLERLEKLEYVLINRANQGNRYFYELTYDGRGQDGFNFMVGLLNVEELRLKSVNNYNSVEGNTTENEEESSNCKGSNRAETGQKKGGSRSASATYEQTA